MDTTDAELNRVLGGGIVPGSLILLRWTGIGKNFACKSPKTAL
jgi:DNA repair protein RadA/Sms